MITEEDLRMVLGKEIEKSSLNQFSERSGFAKSFISCVMNGKSRISDRLANILGYTKMTVFKRIK